MLIHKWIGTRPARPFKEKRGLAPLGNTPWDKSPLVPLYERGKLEKEWIPAFAGMTKEERELYGGFILRQAQDERTGMREDWIPAFAGMTEVEE